MPGIRNTWGLMLPCSVSWTTVFFSHDRIDGRLNVPIFLIDVSSGRLLDITMISFEPSWYQMLHLKIAAVNTKGTDKGCEFIIILHHYLNMLYLLHPITLIYINLLMINHLSVHVQYNHLWGVAFM